MKCIIVLLVIVFCLNNAGGNLSIAGPRCGTRTCKLQEYCSNYDNQCHPCSEICNQSTHNFDSVLCMKDCQDYLHDIRYVRRDDSGYGNNNTSGVIQRLQHMVTVTLTLTCFVLLVLAFMLILQVWKWKKNNNITFATLRNKFRSKKSSGDKSPPGNGINENAQMNIKPDLRLDMPNSIAQSEHSPATVTTSISRRPAEDSALDYAYDNHAMSNSPSPNSKPHESNF